jgi:hypothetical protein
MHPGQGHDVSSHGGIVSGIGHIVPGQHASAIAGKSNVVSGKTSIAVGGESNIAEGLGGAVLTGL